MEKISILQILFLIVFSGLISVDRLAGLNIMISRPIVVAGIIGLLFGNVYATLMMGIVFEFIGMLEVPVGTTITHDDSFGGYVGAVAIVFGFIKPDAVNILSSIFIISILMYPVTLSDRLYRKTNQYFIKSSIDKYKLKNENKLVALGIVLAFVRGIIVYNMGALFVLVFMYIVCNIEFNMEKMDTPTIALTIITVFMLGYLIRFLIISKIYKVILLILGITIGWYVI